MNELIIVAFLLGLATQGYAPNQPGLSRMASAAEDCDRVAGTCIADIPRQELVIVAEEPGASVNDVQSAVTAIRRAQPMHVSTMPVDALAIPELGTTVLWTRGGSDALPATLSSMRGVDVARPTLWQVDGGNPVSIPPTDPYYSRQWALRAINAADAWSISTGSTAVVGIIDTGVDCRHADIGEACTDSVQHYDARSRRWLDKTAVIDGLGHGTHVAGTCCAPANGRGVVGVAPNATVISFRACSSGGSCADLDIAAAIVASWGRVNVINMSLGGPQSAYSRLVCDALHTARDEYRMLAIASAGNAGRAQAMYPAACPGVIGVGSTDPPTGERVSSFSQRAAVDLAAPGRDILSTWLSSDGDYKTISGTSMAAPHVTGVAALLYAASRERGFGDPRPVDVERAMEQTARRICGNDYREDLCGWGLVQAGDAARWIAPDQATATATDLPVEPTDPPDPWLVSPTPTATITVTATLDCTLDPIACAVATARAATAEAAATGTAAAATPTAHIVTAVPTPAPGTPTATRFWPPSATPTRTPTTAPTPTACADPLGCARATVTARAAATATERALRTAVAATVRVPTPTPVPPIETLVARLETAEACSASRPDLPRPCRVITLYYPIALTGPRATEAPTEGAYPGPAESPTPCDEGSTPAQCAARATRTAEAGRTPLPTRCPGLVCP